jgi:AraC-like DNA-binding protein
VRIGRAPAAVEGALPLWPPLLAARGIGAASTRHAHHAMHIVLAVRGELSVRVRDAEARSAAGVVTAPDVPHAIDAEGKDTLLVFLDPESAAGASLLPSLAGEARLLEAGERDRLLEDAEPLAIMTTRAGEAWTRRAVSILGGENLAARKRVHPRVRAALAILRADPERDQASLEALARAVDLSPGRLMHAFTQSIGIPLRPYLQWLKVQRAAGAIAAGSSLSEAAHAAGFADAAHMSRMFRRMFGASPSSLRAAARGARDSS